MGIAILRTAAALVSAALLCAVAPASAADPVVLFDEGHGQQFLSGRTGDLQLSGLADLMRAEGLQVRSTRQRLDGATLAGVGAVVISGAFSPLAPDEIQALHLFVAAGGRLAVMLHIGPPIQSLLESMGIQYSRGPIHEVDGRIGGKGTDFAVTRLERHPLTDGLSGFSVFGCWALQSASAGVRALARTGPHAWLDTDNNGVHSPADLDGQEAVLLAGGSGHGEFAVFGDDAIFQNRFLKDHNRELGRRLARWLAKGASAPAPRRGVTDL